MFIVMYAFADGTPDEIIAVSKNLLKAQKRFLEEALKVIPDFQQNCVDQALDEGYILYENKCLCLLDTSNAENLDA